MTKVHLFGMTLVFALACARIRLAVKMMNRVRFPQTHPECRWEDVP
jgi:hypothetical protein